MKESITKSSKWKESKNSRVYRKIALLTFTNPEEVYELAHRGFARSRKESLIIRLLVKNKVIS